MLARRGEAMPPVAATDKTVEVGASLTVRQNVRSDGSALN